MTFPNGKPAGDTVEQFLGQFVSFELAPVREVRDGEPHMETCATEEAHIWSIYGREADGCALLVHDADDVDSAVMHLLTLGRHFGKPVSICDPARGQWGGDATDMLIGLARFGSRELDVFITALERALGIYGGRVPA